MGLWAESPGLTLTRTRPEFTPSTTWPTSLASVCKAITSQWPPPTWPLLQSTSPPLSSTLRRLLRRRLLSSRLTLPLSPGSARDPLLLSLLVFLLPTLLDLTSPDSQLLDFLSTMPELLDSQLSTMPELPD